LILKLDSLKAFVASQEFRSSIELNKKKEKKLWSLPEQSDCEIVSLKGRKNGKTFFSFFHNALLDPDPKIPDFTLSLHIHTKGT
jgi:hypothetical protein